MSDQADTREPALVRMMLRARAAPRFDIALNPVDLCPSETDVFSIALTSLIYGLLFVAWRHLQPSGIVFYQGIFLAVFACVAQFTVLTLLRSGTPSSRMKDSLFSFLLLYSLVFTIPTTVDRAYSVRMILEIEKSPVGLTREQIEHWFASEFLAQGGVDKRLVEQLTTGSIVQRGEQYELTPLGQKLALSFRVSQSLFATARIAQPPAAQPP